MPEIEVEFGLDFNEKDAFIDLDHYRRLVHTYVDMVRRKDYIGDCCTFNSVNNPNILTAPVQDCSVLGRESVHAEQT